MPYIEIRRRKWMAGPTLVQRQWTEDLIAGEIRLRCSFERLGKELRQFTVQLELCWAEHWRPIVRYDNAHGFCHRDTIHANGSQDRTAVFVGDISATFTYAIQDLKAHWQVHRERYLKEINP
jgi:hypothetical protein